ncbi:MAG: hypothetical protein K2X87_08405 [Gemmataceae bacterium]|nr:hypothetical protein [Gemmataceae bacterium]
MYSYDALGRQDSVTETAAGQPDRVTNTDYDTGGRVTRASGPEGVINYRYEDGTGRLVGMWTGGAGGGPTPPRSDGSGLSLVVVQFGVFALRFPRELKALFFKVYHYPLPTHVDSHKSAGNLLG